LQEQQEELRLAWHDLWFEIATALRIPALTKRLGMVERQWVVEARKRRSR
jgi:hypothetical protein